MRHEFDHMHFQTSIQKATSCFKPKQTAADNDGFPGFLRVTHDVERVVQGSKKKDAFFEFTALSRGQILHRRNEGLGAGGKQEPVIKFLNPSGTMHGSALSIDRLHSNARMKLDPVFAIPLQ